jgi:hypothetical protein
MRRLSKSLPPLAGGVPARWAFWSERENKRYGHVPRQLRSYSTLSGSVGFDSFGSTSVPVTILMWSCVRHYIVLIAEFLDVGPRGYELLFTCFEKTVPIHYIREG